MINIVNTPVRLHDLCLFYDVVKVRVFIMFCELGPSRSIEASTERDACVLSATISGVNRGCELHSKLSQEYK